MQNFPWLTQQQVRDLAWAIFSPNLIDDYSFHPDGGDVKSNRIALTTPRRAWLLQLNENPSPLLQAIDHTHSTRLGHYFEALWQFFLKTDPQFELLAANMRIYEKKQTVGEFDLLYRDQESDENVHLELAAKYYLETPAISSLPSAQTCFSNWLGPNTQDRLDLKLQHLLSHQIKLAELTAARQYLHNMGILKPHKQIAMKGCLFYRQLPPTTNSYPLNADHWRGQWMHWHELSERDVSPWRWYLLPHRQWLSPALLHESEWPEKVIEGTQLLKWLSEFFAAAKIPAIMLCALEEKGEFLLESKRLMITTSHWPYMQATQAGDI